jgi:hypothetical protein
MKRIAAILTAIALLTLPALAEFEGAYYTTKGPKNERTAGRAIVWLWEDGNMWIELFERDTVTVTLIGTWTQKGDNYRLSYVDDEYVIHGTASELHDLCTMTFRTRDGKFAGKIQATWFE